MWSSKDYCASAYLLPPPDVRRSGVLLAKSLSVPVEGVEVVGVAKASESPSAGKLSSGYLLAQQKERNFLYRPKRLFLNLRVDAVVLLRGAGVGAAAVKAADVHGPE